MHKPDPSESRIDPVATRGLSILGYAVLGAVGAGLVALAIRAAPDTLPAARALWNNGALREFSARVVVLAGALTLLLLSYQHVVRRWPAVRVRTNRYGLWVVSLGFVALILWLGITDTSGP